MSKLVERINAIQAILNVLQDELADVRAMLESSSESAAGESSAAQPPAAAPSSIESMTAEQYEILMQMFEETETEIRKWAARCSNATNYVEAREAQIQMQNEYDFIYQNYREGDINAAMILDDVHREVMNANYVVQSFVSQNARTIPESES